MRTSRTLQNRGRLLVAGVVVLALAGCASSPTLTTPLTLPRSVPFASSAGASDALRDECLLESNFAGHLRAALSDEYQSVSQADRITPATPGRTLTARLSQVQATGKSVTSLTVDGVLRDNGRVIGSFTAYREIPGVTGASRCGQLLQLSRLLSRDIAHWARAPSMNARLGTP